MGLANVLLSCGSTKLESKRIARREGCVSVAKASNTAGAGAPLTIVVLVKYIPDAQFDRHLGGAQHTIDRAESILSELDEYPLEAALQLAEARGGASAGNRVIAVTMGPESASAAVKKALQIGAYEGVHLSDPALAGSDVAGTSKALGALIGSLGPVDLVLTGMASTDGETSLVPAQLAARLGFGQATFAAALELDGDLAVARRDGDAFSEVIEVRLPAVISVTDQINDPRYPNFKGIMAAKKRKIEVLTLAGIGLDPATVGASGAQAVVARSQPVPARGAGVLITDSGDAGIALVDFLADQKLL